MANLVGRGSGKAVNISQRDFVCIDHGSAGRKSCRAGPRVCHVLEIKRRWDRLGGESVLHTMSVRKPSRFVGFLSAVPEPRPTKLTTRPTARAPISDITSPCENENENENEAIVRYQQVYPPSTTKLLPVK